MLPIVPLGDTAALAYLPDEGAAARFAAAARAGDVPGRLDVVQAYASVAVFFDPRLTTFGRMVEWLRGLDLTAAAPVPAGPPRRVEPERPHAARAGPPCRRLFSAPYRRPGALPADRPGRVQPVARPPARRWGAVIMLLHASHPLGRIVLIVSIG